MHTDLTPRTPAKWGRAVRALLVASTAAVTIAAGVAFAGSASADEIGQAPTAANITDDGDFATSSTAITGASGFRGGIVYYPTTTGQYPVVAIVPGFTERWSQMSWMGPRLASWGFVVVGIDTNSTSDNPNSRGTQLRSALDWAVQSSPTAVRSRVDGTRRGVAGHSMGGGGTLAALAQDTTGQIKAGVPFAPYHSDKSWPEVTELITIVGAENDGIARPSSHAIRFYESAAGQKAYVEVNGASHTFSSRQNAVLSQALVTTFKVGLNGDTRFAPYRCQYATGTSDFRSNSC